MTTTPTHQQHACTARPPARTPQGSAVPRLSPPGGRGAQHLASGYLALPFTGASGPPACLQAPRSGAQCPGELRSSSERVRPEGVPRRGVRGKDRAACLRPPGCAQEGHGVPRMGMPRRGAPAPRRGAPQSIFNHCHAHRRATTRTATAAPVHTKGVGKVSLPVPRRGAPFAFIHRSRCGSGVRDTRR
jgi:hypothetical protein